MGKVFAVENRAKIVQIRQPEISENRNALKNASSGRILA